MSQYKAYPKYKDSGIEWIGQVPGHWVTGSLKHVIAEISSGTSVNAADTPAQNGELGVLKTSCVSSGKFDPSENKAVVPEEYDRVTCPVESGALIVSRMNTPNLVGAAGLVSHAPDGIFLPDRLWQVSFTGMVPVFAYYWSQSSLYRTQVKVICTGTSSSMQNLSQDDFKNFVLGFPDLEEQTAIAATLDRETARIDALIEKKNRFIELLKEKRQALITHAVTKGLDPNVPMKDSGIEWIGQVPEHWQIAQLKRLVSIQNGSDHKAIETDDGYPVYGSGGQFAYASSYIYDGESVLLGRKGTIDRPMYVNEKFWTVDTMYWTKILPNTDGKFCYYAATTIPFSYYATNTALPSMTQSSLGAHLMAYPPLKEQAAISATLDRETARIDTLVEKTKQSITLLKERRAAFITAAVTGQIDLRGEH